MQVEVTPQELANIVHGLRLLRVNYTEAVKPLTDALPFEDLGALLRRLARQTREAPLIDPGDAPK